MNDTTLPKAKSKAAVPRRKTGRFGLADWYRLLHHSHDLAQRKGAPLRRIQRKEIHQHQSVHDGWIILKGKVYNISPYLAYHPGGEQILKQVLGKDATGLYEKYHRWVNAEGLIGKLLIGYLDNSSVDDDDSEDVQDEMGHLQPISEDGFAVPEPRLR